MANLELLREIGKLTNYKANEILLQNDPGDTMYMAILSCYLNPAFEKLKRGSVFTGYTMIYARRNLCCMPR